MRGKRFIVTCDIQMSLSFHLYGELRLDYISAYRPYERYSTNFGVEDAGGPMHPDSHRVYSLQLLWRCPESERSSAGQNPTRLCRCFTQ